MLFEDLLQKKEVKFLLHFWNRLINTVVNWECCYLNNFTSFTLQSLELVYIIQIKVGKFNKRVKLFK